MRTGLPLFILTLAIAQMQVARAEEQSREVLEQKYQKKLSQEFVSKTPWERELKNAAKKSAETERLIVGYFTRSYSP